MSGNHVLVICFLSQVPDEFTLKDGVQVDLRLLNADDGAFQYRGGYSQDDHLMDACTQMFQRQHFSTLMDIQRLGIVLNFKSSRRVIENILQEPIDRCKSR
jgi:hypothetical protein